MSPKFLVQWKEAWTRSKKGKGEPRLLRRVYLEPSNPFNTFPRLRTILSPLNLFEFSRSFSMVLLSMLIPIQIS